MIDRRMPNPGEHMVYHVGDLATERMRFTTDVSKEQQEESRALHDHASALYAASVRGEVILVQQRVNNTTVYIAVGVQKLRPLPNGKFHRALVPSWGDER